MMFLPGILLVLFSIREMVCFVPPVDTLHSRLLRVFIACALLNGLGLMYLAST